MNDLSMPSPWIIPAAERAERRGAQAIREAAEQHAHAVLEAARQAAQHHEKRACEEGLRQGLERAALLLASAHRDLQELLQAQRDETLELVLAVAHRVLNAIPASVRLPQMAQECIAEYANEQHLVVRVAPSLVALVRDVVDTRDARIEIVADAGLVEGEGWVLHRAGRTEFGLLAQFRAMLAAAEHARG